MPASANKKKQQGEHDLSDSSREGWTVPAPSFQRSATCTAPAAGDEATRRREGPAETAPPAPSALEEQLIAAVGSNPPPPSSSSPPSHSPPPTPERSAREAFTTHAGHGELFVQLAQGFPFFSVCICPIRFCTVAVLSLPLDRSMAAIFSRSEVQ